MAVALGSNPSIQPGSASQALAAPTLALEEEDAIIHSRITNDERPLRRVVKKFHSYTAAILDPINPLLRSPGGQNTIEELREAFLVELASFQLSLKKSAMICEAEARQVEEYNSERRRIELEHGSLKGQIEQLKTSLDHEQTVRRRKIEYDLVAEKVNTLPSRAELELTIQELQSDIQAIRAEHETQNRMIQGQKTALDGIIADLGSLRIMGKDKDTTASVIPSPTATPAPENSLDIDSGDNEGSVPNVVVTTGRLSDTGEMADKETEDEDKVPTNNGQNTTKLNPRATTFHPAPSPSRAHSPSSKQAQEDDIEMGEVEEPKYSPSKGRRNRDELEEGEASDSSHALTEPPDD